MKKQWTIFLTAIMFLTRIRVPKNIDHSPEYLQQSPKYFPLVGWVVAIVSLVTFIVAKKIFPIEVALLAMLIAGILTTGAFHEDGFADCCDGFGGGWTKEKILAIMKDSRLGTYGVIGLLFMLSTKFLLLKEISTFAPLSISAIFYPTLNYKIFIGVTIVAHALSRFMAVTVIQQYNYVTDDDVSKSKPLASQKLSFTELTMAALFVVIPFILLPSLFILGIIPVIIARWYMAIYFKKWIGGYTGDCLGAVQQVTEIVFYLSSIIIWKYI